MIATTHHIFSTFLLSTCLHCNTQLFLWLQNLIASLCTCLYLSVFKKTDNRKRCYRKHFSIVQITRQMYHQTLQNLMYKLHMQCLYTSTSLSERPDVNVVSRCFFAHKEMYPLAKRYDNVRDTSDVKMWENGLAVTYKPHTLIITGEKKMIKNIYHQIIHWLQVTFQSHVYYIHFTDPARKIRHKSVSPRTDGDYRYWPNKDPT
jgi:hypothetical protein